jgi:serine/threonine protein kinase
MIDKYEYVRLSDLGISRMINEENKGDNAGTLGYMSPKVMFKRNHGVAVDYFGLGVIAYEAITGKVIDS